MYIEVFNDIVKLVFKIILGFILFGIFLYFNLNSRYYPNSFDIRVNKTEISLSHCEYYKNTIIPFVLDARNGFCASEISETGRPNKVSSKKYELIINEYEVYNNKNKKVEKHAFYLSDSLINKKIEISDCDIEIMRNNKILYEGEYIKNISKYITESGRYYFKIYVHRKNSLSSSVSTKITFSILAEVTADGK